MKNLFLLIILFSLTTTLFAQNETKARQEIDLVLRDFTSFGSAYRIGNDASLWRIGLNFSTNTQKSESMADSLENIDARTFFDISLGWEKRFEVVDKLFLRIGGDAFYQNTKIKDENYQNISFGQTSTSDVRTNGLGIRLVLGTMYQINPNIHIGFEVLPQFIRSNSSTERTFTTANSMGTSNMEASSTGFNLNTSSLRINFGFNF